MSDERTPPKRVRITGLQEQQLAAVAQAEAAATAIYYENGFDAAEVPTRAAPEIVALTRHHNVRVAEADHEPVGYAAWRDEAPGVAYIEEISVHPDFQRFGVGSKLMESIRDEAREAGLKQIVLRCWTRAPWAMGFYRSLGFAAIDEAAPAKVRAWHDEHASSGKPVTRPGEVVLWAAVGEAPVVPDEPEDEEANDESA